MENKNEYQLSHNFGFEVLIDNDEIFLTSHYNYNQYNCLQFPKSEAVEFCNFLKLYLKRDTLIDYRFTLSDNQFTIKFFREKFIGSDQPMLLIIDANDCNSETTDFLNKEVATASGFVLNYEMLPLFINELEKLSKSI